MSIISSVILWELYLCNVMGIISSEIIGIISSVWKLYLVLEIMSSA